MALGTRAISRYPGGGGSGISNAKKIADLYASTHTDEGGDVSDPGVYDHIINNVLAPFAGTLDGQNVIADYTNKKKSLVAKKSEIETTVAGLKQKEYDAWYVDDDEEDNTSFRNPAWVAQVTSESLDYLVAETIATIEQLESRNKSTVELENYLRDLSKRADRMRTVSQSLEDGTAADLDGYGYFVDTDPNTGKMSGASFMPVDAKFADLAEGKIRTDSMVSAGSKKVPLYLTAVKDASGATKTLFGGKEYTGNESGLSGDGGEVALTDRNSYQSGAATFQIGKVYKTFSGRTNIDGSPKNSFYYVGHDNKMYGFDDSDANGKALLASLSSVGAISDVKTLPRMSPTAIRGLAVNPLPDSNFVAKESQAGKIDVFQSQAIAAQAEADALENRGSLDTFFAGVSDPDAPMNQGGMTAVKAVAGAIPNAIKGFFNRKNRKSVPEQAPTARGGQYNPGDVIDQSGTAIFNSRGSQ